MTPSSPAKRALSADLPPVPTFENPADEIAFWESQEWTPDEIATWEAQGLPPSLPMPSPGDSLPKNRGLTIRFTEPTLRMLKYAANRRGLSVGALARMWLLEKLAEDVEPE
jgi:hypothetical protein